MFLHVVVVDLVHDKFVKDGYLAIHTVIMLARHTLLLSLIRALRPCLLQLKGLQGLYVAEHQVEQQLLLLARTRLDCLLVCVVVDLEESRGLVVIMSVPISGAAFVLPPQDLVVVLLVLAGAV